MSHCAGTAELKAGAEEDVGLSAGVLAGEDLWVAAEEAENEVGRTKTGREEVSPLW